MIKIGLLGYNGRMGRLIATEIADHNGCKLSGGAVRTIDPARADTDIISTDVLKVISGCDVVIDFTTAEVTPENARRTADLGKPFMSGTTGLTPDGMAGLKKAAEKIPLLFAPNTSLSLAVTKSLAGLAARKLANFNFDVAITDEHHRMKKDQPSGTALALGGAVVLGNNGAKQPSYSAVRAGYIVGEHEVIFAGEGELIRIHHSVTDRRIFARGALMAALWLHGKPNGLYGMDDVLSV